MSLRFTLSLALLLLLPALGAAQDAPEKTAARIADTALLMAAEAGRADLVAFALEHGADIESRDRRPRRSTALVLAVEGGHLSVVRLLLAEGADPARRYRRNSPTSMLPTASRS